MTSPTKKNEMDATYVQRISEDNRRYTRDLLLENENLRLLVAALRKERQDLVNGASVQGPLLDELTKLREEQARHRREQEEWRRQISEIETQNRKFSEGYVEVEKRNSDLMNLYVASYRLHGTVDRHEVIGTIQEIVGNLVGCEENGIFELSPSGDELKLIASIGIDASAFESIKVGEGLIGKTARDGETFVADQGDADQKNRENLTACIPLKLNGEVTGAIALFRMLPQKPSLEGLDHEMFDLLATHAATALYCSRLHAEHGPSACTEHSRS